MTRTEANARRAAAVQRIARTEPLAVLFYTAITVTAWLFRGLAHLCLAFGGVSMAGLSLWWGLPLALLSAATAGRVWEWMRRDRDVYGVEAAADAADAKATGRVS